MPKYTWACLIFQSTRPVWGATIEARILAWLANISIHAPRVGRDYALAVLVVNDMQFQSTRPVWGATLLQGA